MYPAIFASIVVPEIATEERKHLIPRGYESYKLCPVSFYCVRLVVRRNPKAEITMAKMNVIEGVNSICFLRFDQVFAAMWHACRFLLA